MAVRNGRGGDEIGWRGWGLGEVGGVDAGSLVLAHRGSFSQKEIRPKRPILPPSPENPRASIPS